MSARENLIKIYDLNVIHILTLIIIPNLNRILNLLTVDFEDS